MHSITKISLALLVVSLFSDALTEPNLPFFNLFDQLKGPGGVNGGCNKPGPPGPPGPPGGGPSGPPGGYYGPPGGGPPGGYYGSQPVFKQWFWDWLNIIEPWFHKYYDIAGNNCGKDFENWCSTIFNCIDNLQNWCKPNGGQIAPC